MCSQTAPVTSSGVCPDRRNLSSTYNDVEVYKTGFTMEKMLWTCSRAVSKWAVGWLDRRAPEWVSVSGGLALGGCFRLGTYCY